MRRVLTGAILTVGILWSASVFAAPQPDKSLLGVRIMDTWKTVLSKYGQPTRVEAGPPAEISLGPTTSTGGFSMTAPPGMGGRAGMMGMAGMPGMSGGMRAPMGAMMGGMSAPMSAMNPMSSAGMTGGMSAPRAMGGASAMGGTSAMMARPPMGSMMGPSSAGGMTGMSSAMMGAPAGMPMGPMSSAGGGSGLPGLGGMGMSSGISAPMGAMMGGRLSTPGMPAGMMGATSGMAGGGRMTSAYGQTATTPAIETGPGEVAWVYEKGTNTQIFLFNNEGRVIQIQSFGYKGGARTVNGVSLGDTASKIYSIYGFPEQTIVSGNTRTLDYSKRANVAFQLADRDGKGMRVVGITVGLTKAPNPEKPEE